MRLKINSIDYDHVFVACPLSLFMKSLVAKRVAIVSFYEKVMLLSNTEFVLGREKLKDLLDAIARDLRKFRQELCGLRPIPDLICLECPRDVITRVGEVCGIIESESIDLKGLCAALPVTDRQLELVVDAIVNSKRPIHALHNDFMNALGRNRDLLYERGKDAAFRFEEAFLVAEFSSAAAHFIGEMGAERVPSPAPAPAPAPVPAPTPAPVPPPEKEVSPEVEQLETTFKNLVSAQGHIEGELNIHFSQMDQERERAMKLENDIDQFRNATMDRLEQLRRPQPKPQPRAKKILAIPVNPTGPDKELFEKIGKFDRQISELRYTGNLQIQIQKLEDAISSLPNPHSTIEQIEHIQKTITDPNADIDAMKAMKSRIETLLRDM